MPKRTSVPDLTGPELSAHRVIQKESRLACLRFLIQSGSATRLEVQNATRLPLTTVAETLAELERCEYIAADIEQGQRVGARAVRYTVDRAKVTSDLLALAGWILR